MSQLILLRHGESMWNKKNVFTGWVDIPLSKGGIDEALKAGEKIKNQPIDVIFTTPLMRASMTAMLVMSVHHSGKTPVIQHPDEGKMEEWGTIYNDQLEIIPVYIAWQLNERMYGQLQGMNKQEMADRFGAEQIKQWRRSYAICPPGGESLQMTAERSIPYFKEKVIPLLAEGKNVLIAAHGNSLRSIIMHLEQLTEDEVLSLELATGQPLTYQYQHGLFRQQHSH